MKKSLALVCALVLGALLAWLAARTPAPQPANAPIAAFSAGRAMADVRALAVAPHPTGSPANARVRDHLVARLQGLGLEPQVRRADTVAADLRGRGFVEGGTVENVVAVMPGKDRNAPALAVMSHYDSVPGSPGAADDGAGVASALEIARALKATGGPRRDVIFVLTDGEEAGLLGARAFFADDPLAKRVGAVVNMDVRGGGGRAFMFETTRGDGPTIDLFARNAVHPSSNSLATFLYAHMPNGTDFTVPREKGLVGVNFAFIGRPFHYHSPSATPANLERGALQHIGEQALAAARAFADTPVLPARGPDTVYTDLFGQRVVAYPPAFGWLPIVLAAALAGYALVRTRTERKWSWVGAARGVGAAVFLALALVPLLHLVRRLTGAPFDFEGQRPLLALFPVYEAAAAAVCLGAVLFVFTALNRGALRALVAGGMLFAAIAASALHGADLLASGCGVAAAALALLVFGRPTSFWSAWAGFLGLGLALAIAVQITAPEAAFLFAWPVLAAAGLAALLVATGDDFVNKPGPVLACVVVSALVLGQLGAMAHGVFLGVGADLPSAVAVFALLAALVLYPLLRRFAVWRDSRAAGLAFLASGLLVAAVLSVVDPAGPATPRDSQVLYVTDLDRGRFYRASGLFRLDAWSRGALEADGGAVREGRLPPFWSQPVRLADAKPATVAEPRLAITRAPDGRVVTRLEPGSGSRQIRLQLRVDAPARGLTVNGRPVDLALKPGAWTWVNWSGTPDALEIAFRPEKAGRVEVRAATVSEGWPAGAKPLPPRPASVARWGWSDSTVAIRSAEARF